jgi:hypothetical protein
MNRTERRQQARANRGHSKPPKVRKVWERIDTIKHAIDGAAITAPNHLDELHMRELAALAAFSHGVASLRDWDDLATLNNITQTLAGMGVGREAMPDAHAAEAALIDAAERFQRTGRMGLTGPGMQALREVIEWHHLQRTSIARSQYEQAIRLTAARIKSGHATIDLSKTLNTCPGGGNGENA